MLPGFRRTEKIFPRIPRNLCIIFGIRQRIFLYFRIRLSGTAGRHSFPRGEGAPEGGRMRNAGASFSIQDYFQALNHVDTWRRTGRLPKLQVFRPHSCDSPRAGLRPVARLHTPAGVVIRPGLRPAHLPPPGEGMAACGRFEPLIRIPGEGLGKKNLYQIFSRFLEKKPFSPCEACRKLI